MSSKRKIVIFSLDNTLRDTAWRLNLIPFGVRRKNPLEWAKFHAAGMQDEPIKEMLALFKMYVNNPDYDVHIWANSVEECREDIRKWFSHQGVVGRSYQQLYLRPDGNQLSNKEIYERWLQSTPKDELDRISVVISNDDALCEVFNANHIDVLKLNGVDTQ